MREAGRAVSIEKFGRAPVDGGTDEEMAAGVATGSIISVKKGLGVREEYRPSRNAAACARADFCDGGVRCQGMAKMTGRETRCWTP